MIRCIMLGTEDEMQHPETPVRRCRSVSDIDAWSDGSEHSIYVSCINDAENCHERDMFSHNNLSIDFRDVNQGNEDIPAQNKCTICTNEQFLKEVRVPHNKISCNSNIFSQCNDLRFYTETPNSAYYIETSNRAHNTETSNRAHNTETPNPSTTNACIGSLDSIIRLVQSGIAHFQNATNENWTLRETNFYKKTMTDLSATAERMKQFHQRGQTTSSMMDFNAHLLEIFRLNVESLLLNIEAFIRCSSSLQNFRNNGSIALYPEELIHSIKVVIEQSSKAVCSAWSTFLQFNTNQTDGLTSITHSQPSDHPLAKSSTNQRDGIAYPQPIDHPVPKSSTNQTDGLPSITHSQPSDHPVAKSSTNQMDGIAYPQPSDHPVAKSTTNQTDGLASIAHPQPSDHRVPKSSTNQMDSLTNSQSSDHRVPKSSTNQTDSLTNSQSSDHPLAKSSTNQRDGIAYPQPIDHPVPKSSTNQTDGLTSITCPQPSNHPVTKSSGCETFDHSKQSELHPVTQNLKENVLSPKETCGHSTQSELNPVNQNLKENVLSPNETFDHSKQSESNPANQNLKENVLSPNETFDHSKQSELHPVTQNLKENVLSPKETCGHSTQNELNPVNQNLKENVLSPNETFDHSKQSESNPVNQNLKENVLFRNVCLRKEDGNIDHQTQHNAEERTASNSSPCGTALQQNQRTFIMKECFVPLEKIDDRFLSARPGISTSRKYSKLSESDTLYRKQLSNNRDPISVAPGYEDVRSDKVSENTPKEAQKKGVFRSHTIMADDRKKALLQTGEKYQHAKGKSIPCEPLALSPDHMTPVGISSRKLSENSDLTENSLENDAQILCISEGTQTPSKTKSFSIKHTSDHHKTTENGHQNQDHGRHCNKSDRKVHRSFVSSCESLNKGRKGCDSILSQRSEKNKERQTSCKSRTKLSFGSNQNTNLPSEEDYSVTTKDKSLISFVSSVKSYKSTSSSVHVSLQVYCVERNVLARKLRAEEAIRSSHSEKEHQSRTKNLEVIRTRKCGTFQSNKRRLAAEKRSDLIPFKRIKKYSEERAMKLKNSNNEYSQDDPNEMSKKDDSNINELEIWNKKHSTPMKDDKFQYEPVRRHSAACSENLENGNVRGQTLKLLEDESMFFLNQQAEMTAKIKSMKKQKANIVTSSMPSTANSTKNQIPDKIRFSQKLPDLNNNL